jgi:hypothetical protein
MTRRSERELKNDIDGLQQGYGDCSVQDYLLAAVKDCYDSTLSKTEQALLADPDGQLSPEAKRHIEEWQHD